MEHTYIALANFGTRDTAEHYGHEVVNELIRRGTARDDVRWRIKDGALIVEVAEPTQH